MLPSVFKDPNDISEPGYYQTLALGAPCLEVLPFYSIARAHHSKVLDFVGQRNEIFLPIGLDGMM